MKESRLIKNITVILFSFFLLFSSYSVYMALFPTLNYVRYLTPFVCFVFSIFYYLRHPINVRVLVEPLVVVTILMLLSFINGSNIIGMLMIAFNVLTIYYAVSAFILQGYDMMYWLYKVIFFLAVVFLVFYIVFDIFFPKAGLSYYYKMDTGTFIYSGHYNIYFRWATSTEIFGFKILRCSGFCWEPGQYQIYLNYALMYLLFFDEGRERCKILKIIVITIAIISTASTMGYIIAVALFAGIILNLNSKVKYFILIIISFIAVLLIFRLINEKQETSTFSYTTRASEFEYLSDVLFINGPFGKGLYSENIVNALLCFVWDYGYIAIGICVLLVFYIFNNNAFFLNNKHKVFFIIWFLFSLINEPIQYMNFTFAIVSFISLGVVIRKNVLLQKRITP